MAARCSRSRAGREPSSLQGGSGPAVHRVPSRGHDCQELKGLSQISAGTGNVTQRAPTTRKTIPLEKHTNGTRPGMSITAMNIEALSKPVLLRMGPAQPFSAALGPCGLALGWVG